MGMWYHREAVKSKEPNKEGIRCPLTWQKPVRLTGSGISSTPPESLSDGSRHKPPSCCAASTSQYTPHVDCGDHVIVINCAKAVLTGKKLEQKKWYRHTGWIGHLKETDYGTLMEKRPEKAMELAVKGMIPDTTIGRAARLRLRAFAGSTHTHAAQKPEAFEF